MQSTDALYRVLIDLSDDLRSEDSILKNVRELSIDKTISSITYKTIDTVLVSDTFDSEEFFIEHAELSKRFLEWVNSIKGMRPFVADCMFANQSNAWDHNLRYVHMWLYSVRHCMAENLNKRFVFYLPKSRTTSQILLYEAEGETTRQNLSKLIYKRTDFLLHYIIQYLSSLPCVEIRWYKETRRGAGLVPLFVKRLVRSYGIHLFRATCHLKNRLEHFLTSAKKTEGLSDLADPVFVVVVRGQAQAEYLSQLGGCSNAIFIICDNFLRYPDTWRLFDQITKGSACAKSLYDFTGTFRIIKSGVRILVELLRFDVSHIVNSPSSFNLAGPYPVRIDTWQLFREAIVNSYEPTLLCKAVFELNKSVPRLCAIMHMEQATAYPFFLHKQSRGLGLKTIQMALGSYRFAPFVRFIWADVFLTYTVLMRDSLLRYDIYSDSDIQFWGNLLFQESTGKLSGQDSGREKKIAFLTQPYEMENERELVAILRRWCRGNLFSLDIALHPRDAKDKYTAESSIERVLEHKQLSPMREDWTRSVSMAVTRTSTAAYYLLMCDTPFVRVIWSTADTTVTQDFENGYPLSARTEKELVNILNNLDVSQAEYHRFRDGYIEKSIARMGRDQFLIKLLEFVRS
jgi:hypothetical protein